MNTKRRGSGIRTLGYIICVVRPGYDMLWSCRVSWRCMQKPDLYVPLDARTGNHKCRYNGALMLSLPVLCSHALVLTYERRGFCHEESSEDCGHVMNGPMVMGHSVNGLGFYLCLSDPARGPSSASTQFMVVIPGTIPFRAFGIASSPS